MLKLQMEGYQTPLGGTTIGTAPDEGVPVIPRARSRWTTAVQIEAKQICFHIFEEETRHLCGMNVGKKMHVQQH